MKMPKSSTTRKKSSMTHCRVATHRLRDVAFALDKEVLQYLNIKK